MNHLEMSTETPTRLFPRACSKCDVVLEFDRIATHNVAYCSRCGSEFSGYDPEQEKEYHQMMINMAWDEIKECLNKKVDERNIF